jgi:hypothetical protein
MVLCASQVIELLSSLTFKVTFDHLYYSIYLLNFIKSYFIHSFLLSSLIFLFMFDHSSYSKYLFKDIKL